MASQDSYATFLQRLLSLKARSTHSPSVSEVEELLGQPVAIDACFLANPYATDLFAELIERDLVATGRLKTLLGSYPPQNQRLAADLGPVLGVEPGKLFVANGASEAIQAVLTTYASGRVLMHVPTFSPFHEFATDAVITIPCLEEDPQARADLLIRSVRHHRPDTVVIINPNNPDGFCYPPQLLEVLLRTLSPLVSEIVLDESFLSFSSQDRPRSQAALVGELPNLTVIASMSKDFGIAGLRLGYAVMAPDRVRALLSRGFLWNCNSFITYVVSLLADPEFQARYELARRKYVAETTRFLAALRELPFCYTYPSKASFALLCMDPQVNAADVMGWMLYHHGIYTRLCNDKLGLNGQFIRIGARVAEQNDLVVKAMLDALTVLSGRR